MPLKTFSAPTMAEALAQVKRALGTDAVILHTRKVPRRRWLGLSRREAVEITAGDAAEYAPRKPRRSEPQSAAAAPASQPKPSATAVMQTPAANAVAVLSLSQEVSSLKSLVGDLVRETRLQRAPGVPQDVFDHYLQLIQNHVAEELAEELVNGVRKQLRPEHLNNGQFVRERLAEQLEKMIPVAGPIARSKRVGPHIVALIGPTGVGKTTTVAKLAANLKLRENRRVGLITIDTYRIAAVDQLRKYAEILGAPLSVVTSPEELRQSIRSMADAEFILIDTAGRAPNDKVKLAELRSFLAAAAPDEVHLVLSSTASQACIESAIARFGEVRVDKIIFTKLDEAVHMGVILNVARGVNKSLSYITTGQDVPEDIEVSKARRLANLILGSGI